MNFAGELLECETIMLNKVTQNQKDIYGMYSLISVYKLQCAEQSCYNPKIQVTTYEVSPKG